MNLDWRYGGSLLGVVAAAVYLAGAGEPSKSVPPADRRPVAKEVVSGMVQRYEEAEVQKFAWGSIHWLMSSKVDPKAEMTLGVVHIEPHQANSLHVHPNCTEYLHVLSGSCEHRLGDGWVQMKAGDTVRIPRHMEHMARTGNESCRAVIVYDTGTRQVVDVMELKQ